jgi:regulatory helix-turn-helix LysR family protein
MRRESLSDLTTFIAVADSLSFRVTASNFGVTASARSHSMRQLEERVGTCLSNRTTRSVVAHRRLVFAFRSACGQPSIRSPARWKI